MFVEFCRIQYRGYFQHPDNCSRFIVCEWGYRFECTCPERTRWDERVLTCVWEYFVPCYHTTTPSPTTTPPTTTTPTTTTPPTTTPPTTTPTTTPTITPPPTTTTPPTTTQPVTTSYTMTTTTLPLTTPPTTTRVYTTSEMTTTMPTTTAATTTPIPPSTTTPIPETTTVPERTTQTIASTTRLPPVPVEPRLRFIAPTVHKRESKPKPDTVTQVHPTANQQLALLTRFFKALPSHFQVFETRSH